MHLRFTVDGPEARRLRVSQGLKGVDVASRVGIDRAYLSRVESHSLRMKPQRFLALCEALGVDNPADLALTSDKAATRRR